VIPPSLCQAYNSTESGFTKPLMLSPEDRVPIESVLRSTVEAAREKHKRAKHELFPGHKLVVLSPRRCPGGAR